ncbi:hypothetical protein FB554_2607 [Barrientosiimonas humi]|uniref:Uncharacterized protein n=1 Tax=Barrientosiimonas humi TaxID=999931 RepID=A0A542XF40_9MICO|nr:hypothetical protein FB554_2607 [Barrientosiimonas humi]CAG7574426.1 hypothetical protein BH39T_PBIAJDOK_03077 [Barrientosiimonas humi]
MSVVGKRRRVRERLAEMSRKELKAQVPREEQRPGDTREKGSFAYGYCKSCDWQGSGRRAREKARRDALEHAELCSGRHKPRIATTDTKK